MELTALAEGTDGMSAAPAAPDGSAAAAPEASNVAQVYGTKQKRMTTNLNFLDNAGTKTAQRRSSLGSGDLSEASDTPRSPGLSEPSDPPVEGMAWDRREDTVEANGIRRKFEGRAKAAGAAVPESQSLSYELDSEGFKVVADQLVEEAGVNAMLYRMFVAPVMDGDKITDPNQEFATAAELDGRVLQVGKKTFRRLTS